MSEAEKKEEQVEEKPEESTEPEKEVPNDLLPTFLPVWDEDEVNAIAGVLDGTFLAESVHVETFEKEFARYVGAKYCVLFPTHSIAMYSALIIAIKRFDTRTIRIPVIGSEPIYNPALQASYNPVLCEVNEVGSLELREYEAGVVYHMNGRLGKPSLIEDCRDMPFHHTKDKLSIYDFSEASHLTLGGIGGAVCCDDLTSYEALLRMKKMGKNPLVEEEFYDYDHKMWGLDFPVSEINAAFGLAQLKHLNEKLSRITEMHKILLEHIKDDDLVKTIPGRPSRYLDILVPDAPYVQNKMISKGFLLERFPKPLHIQTYSGYAGRLDNTFDTSEKLYEQGLYLPSTTNKDGEFGLSDEKLIDMIKAIREIAHEDQ